jgi:hypothetical protein
MSLCARGKIVVGECGRTIVVDEYEQFSQGQGIALGIRKTSKRLLLN